MYQAKGGVRDVATDISTLSWFPWPEPKFPDAVTRYSWGERGGAPDELSVGHQFSKVNGHPNAKDVFRVYSSEIRHH